MAPVQIQRVIELTTGILLNIALSRNIRRHRKRLMISQSQLATKLNVSRNSVTAWETGKSKPSLTHVIMLTDIFKCTFDELAKFI